MKRIPQSAMDGNDSIVGQSPFSMDTMLQSSLRRRLSSPGPSENTKADNKAIELANKTRELLGKQLEGCRDLLIGYLVEHLIHSKVHNFFMRLKYFLSIWIKHLQ